MSEFLRTKSAMHDDHVTAAGILDRFVTAQGLMAGERERQAVLDLFDLAREWQQALDLLRELLDEANSTTLDDSADMRDETREKTE